MIAFDSAVTAAKWALTCQELLLEAEWPEELFKHPDSAVEHDQNGKLM